MIQFKFTAKDAEAINAVKEKLHEALVGSPGYVSNEILLSDGDTDNDFILIVGNDAGEANVNIGIVFDNIEVSQNTDEKEESVEITETVSDQETATESEEELPVCAECMIPQADDAE